MNSEWLDEKFSGCIQYIAEPLQFSLIIIMMMIIIIVKPCLKGSCCVYKTWGTANTSYCLPPCGNLFVLLLACVHTEHSRKSSISKLRSIHSKHQNVSLLGFHWSGATTPLILTCAPCKQAGRRQTLMGLNYQIMSLTVKGIHACVCL